MKTLLTSLSLAIVAFLGSCTSEGAMTSKEDLMSSITGQIGKAVEKLEGVTDKASAEKAKTAVEPMISSAMGALDKLKALPALGGGDIMKMLTEKMGPLTGKITGLTEKFAGKPEIMAVLKPVIEKLTGLVKK